MGKYHEVGLGVLLVFRIDHQQWCALCDRTEAENTPIWIRSEYIPAIERYDITALVSQDKCQQFRSMLDALLEM